MLFFLEMLISCPSLSLKLDMILKHKQININSFGLCSAIPLLKYCPIENFHLDWLVFVELVVVVYYYYTLF